MRRVRINEGKVGLVFRYGDYKRMITEGTYWIKSSERVTIYDRSEPFTPAVDIKRLLKDDALARELTVVELTESQVALQYEYGNFMVLLTSGTYAFWKDEKRYQFLKYNRSLPFTPQTELKILLKNEALANELTVVDLKDHEIALLNEDGNFKRVLEPGRYAFWKGIKDYDVKIVNLRAVDSIEGVDVNILSKREVLPFVRVYEVYQFEKGLLFIDGQYERVLASGTYFFWKNATPISVLKVDSRQLQLEVSGQEILTKDKAGLRVNFQVLYKVTDVEKAVIANKDYEKQLYTLVQLALREFVGTYTLDELLEKKEAIGEYVKDTLKRKTGELGVRVSDGGVRDIILPGDVKDIMNQVLIAQKKAQANVIMRREETASTRSLLNTAKLMEDNEMLFKLKEMEYVEKIADKIGEITVAGNGQVIEPIREKD